MIMLEFVIRILAAGLVGLIIGMFSTNARSARMFGFVAAGAALITVTSTEFYKVIAAPGLVIREDYRRKLYLLWALLVLV